jgi:hypothetical protein
MLIVLRHKKAILSSLLSIIFLGAASCAGRTANPVAMYQPGDNALSCSGLRMTLANTQTDIDTIAPGANKTSSNVGLGIAGAFLLVPWFFMDFSGADEIELKALRRRYNYLIVLYNEKGCDTKQMMQMPTYEELKNNEDMREKFFRELEELQVETEQDAESPD